MEQIDFLKLTDLDEVKRIDDSVFPDDAEDREVYEDRIKTFPDGCWKMIFDERIAGFLTSEAWDQYHSTPLNRKASVCHSPKGKIIYISTLVIIPEYQGKGFGRKLLEFFISKMRGEHRTSVYLRSAKKALRFYEKHGFSFVKKEEDRGIINDILELKL